MSISTAPRVSPTQTKAASILGLATATPAHSIAQTDAALVAQALKLSNRWHDALPALYRKSGVQRRGSVLLGPESIDTSERQSFYSPASESAPFGPSTADRLRVYSDNAGPLLERACDHAIAQSKIEATKFTHLVTVSCTGFFAPGVDIALIQSLGLNSNIQRTHVGFMGCHGALNAIRVAKSIVDADANAIVLLGAVELCSLHQQYTDDAQQLVANALFADGAASLVIAGANWQSRVCEPVEADPMLVAEGAEVAGVADWRIGSTLSKWIPETTDLMSWTIGNHGFQMSLDPQVPGHIEQHLEAELKAWLGEHGLAIQDVDAWAIHPGGPRIIQAVGTSLGLDPVQLVPSQSILAEHGNMSSPTVLFILERLASERPDARSCVLLAFGPGLCIEAVLLSAS